MNLNLIIKKMELTASAIIEKLRTSKFPRTDTSEILKAIKNANLESKMSQKLAQELKESIKNEDKNIVLKEAINQIAEIIV